MSKALSLKLQDVVFQDVEAITKKLNRPRNLYINEAVMFYNKLIERRELKAMLKDESKKISKNSLFVLSELEELEDEIVE